MARLVILRSPQPNTYPPDPFPRRISVHIASLYFCTKRLCYNGPVIKTLGDNVDSSRISKEVYNGTLNF